MPKTGKVNKKKQSNENKLKLLVKLETNPRKPALELVLWEVGKLLGCEAGF